MNRRILGWLLAGLLFPAALAHGYRHSDSDVLRAGQKLTIFAAASLGDAIGEIANQYQHDTGVQVVINAAGSQQLAAQLEHGMPANVFLSADEAWMRRVLDLGLASAPVAFAHNRPVVIVSRRRGDRVRTLPDLARPGIKLVLGAPPVPIGRYSRTALEKLSKLPGYPEDYLARTLANVVSEEDNVKGVASKVQLGEADAGIVYQTDVTPALARHVRVLELPAEAEVLATCWIAVLRGSQEALARDFVARVQSERGRRVLDKYGFETGLKSEVMTPTEAEGDGPRR